MKNENQLEAIRQLTAAIRELTTALNGTTARRSRKRAEPSMLNPSSSPESPISGFIRDCVEMDSASRERASAVYEAYMAYCRRLGVWDAERSVFGAGLTLAGIGSQKRGGNQYRTGIRLKDGTKEIRTK